MNPSEDNAPRVSPRTLLLALALVLVSNARAATFANPYWPISPGVLQFDWKIYSGGTFTGWVEPDEVSPVADEVTIDDEDCDCPSEEFSDCWASPQVSSAQWYIW